MTDVDVPAPDASSTCPYCGVRFPNTRILRLHVGREHADELSAKEGRAVREARKEEARRLRKFQLQALLGLVFLYFGFLFAYAGFS